MLYLLYIIGFGLARILPIKMSYGIAGLVARLYFIFAKKDRVGLSENLRVVLGEGADENDINRHVLGVLRNFAKYLADFFKFSRFTGEYISKYIKLDGIEHLDKCLSEGKGAILVSLHLGNWELGGAVVSALEYPVNALVLEHTSKRINDLFMRQRAINNLVSIPIGIRIRECFKVLKRKEILAIAADKDYTSNGVYVDFFGKKALMPKGPGVFALRTGAPIVFCALIREKDDTFVFRFEEPIWPETTGDVDKDMRRVMKEYLGIFERYIREYPDQWYAFRGIWNQETTIQ